jgi:hypothetical protein
VLRGKSLIVTDEKSAVAVAATGPYLAWEEEGDDTGPLGLKERNLRTGKTLTLAPDGLPEYGLGVTVRRVVYAAPRGNVVSLIAVPHGGGRHVVLSRHLAAPFDARGSRVAWADVSGRMLRVLMHDFASGRSSVLARFTRCAAKGCHNIDRVVVTKHAVAFDLSGIAGAPSRVFQIGFGSKGRHVTVVPNDPQPDLARASSSLLYYALNRGWFRWLPPAKPKLTPFRSVTPWLLDEENGRLLLVTQTGCVQRLAVRLPTGRMFSVPQPAKIPAGTKVFGRVCQQVGGFAWSGNRLFIGWTLVPQVSLGSHHEPGLAGIVTRVVTPG